MLLFGAATCIEAPKDIYPYINIPFVTIVWTYNGLPPQEMEGRIVTVCERALTMTVKRHRAHSVGKLRGSFCHPRLFPNHGKSGTAPPAWWACESQPSQPSSSV
ncbi:MAG: hypothetical protein WA254_22260 [Candidatus Sulfotelmatobacter sp.]